MATTNFSDTQKRFGANMLRNEGSRDELMHKARKANAIKLVESESEITSELFRLSRTNDPRDLHIFVMDETEKLYYRYKNPDGKLGGWVSEASKITGNSRIEYGAVVKEGAVIDSSIVESGAVARSDASVRYGVLDKNGLFRCNDSNGDYISLNPVLYKP